MARSKAPRQEHLGKLGNLKAGNWSMVREWREVQDEVPEIGRGWIM